MDEKIRKRGIKWFYISSSEVEIRIQSGGIDAYDIIFTTDTHEMFVVRDDLSLFNITSKSKVFPSVQAAEASLNSDTSAYVGEVVSVFENANNAFQAYIANKNQVGEFYVSPISVPVGTMDYDTLENIPIIDLVGDNIVLSTKETNLYKVKGSYRICPNDGTLRISTDGRLYFVEKDYAVTEVSGSQIKKYMIVEGSLYEEEYITDKYLDDNEYLSSADAASDAEVRRIFS